MADSIPSPLTSKVVQVSSTTLFHVAAAQLGDATKWNQVAGLNSLLDPWIAGSIVTLSIPANNQNSNGGIAGL